MRRERAGWSVNFNSSWEETILHMIFFVCFLFWLRINNYFKSQLIDELN